MSHIYSFDYIEMLQSIHREAPKVTNEEMEKLGYEVVWSGGELLPDRPTKPGDEWTPPKRLYRGNKQTVEQQRAQKTENKNDKDN